MGTARLAIYIVGLVAVVAAAWILLTQTELAAFVSSGVAIAIILLIVGIGVMASANSIRDGHRTRRVVHETAPGGALDRDVEHETVVEERRWE